MTEVVSMANSHRTLPTPPQHYQDIPRPELSKDLTPVQQPREWLDLQSDKSADMLRRQLLNAIGDNTDEAEQRVATQQKPKTPSVTSIEAATERLQQQHAQAKMLQASSPPPGQRGDNRPSSSLSPGSGGEDGKDRQKRELNTSKRAAQNRNAQRAFRARKEEYIKSLEVKVKDYEAIEERNGALDGENAALRQYIMHLQRRLLDHLGEGEALPEPPVGLNIEGLQISSRPTLPSLLNNKLPALKGDSNGVPVLPPINISGDRPNPDQVAGVKRARVDE